MKKVKTESIADAYKCPYCDQTMEKLDNQQNSCSICGMAISGTRPHIMFVDEETMFHFCSLRCMELHEESLLHDSEGDME